MAQLTTPSPPDFLDRLFQSFSRSLWMTSERTKRPLILALVIVIFFTLLLVLSPTILIADYTYDSFIPLDGAWRMMNGQWPHLDFYTPIGDLYYVTLGIAARLRGIHPQLILWQGVILLPFAVFASVLASHDRLPNSLRAFLIVLVGLLAISPARFDDPSSISFLATYNRHSWTLIIPLMIAALLQPQHAPNRRWCVEAMTMWVIVLALTYLKITFAFASVGILLLSAVIVPANRRSCITALCGALLTLLILTIISPVNRAYWADLQRAAAAAPIDTSSIDPFRLFKLKSDIMAGWIYFFLPVTFAVWLGRTSRDQAERRNGDRILLATLITSGANFGLAWQNYDSAMPAQIVALAITFSGFRQRTLARNSNLYAGHTPPFLSPSTIHDRDRIPVTLAAICLVVMMGAGILRDAIAIIKHTETSVFGVTQPISTLSPALQGLHVPRDNHPSIIGDILNGRIGPDLYTSRSSVTWHNDLPAIIDDGWRLFQAHRPTNPHVATLGFSPIMSYITQTTPPKHVPAWIDQDRTIGLRAPIIPETTFDDTNVIMILKLHDHEIPLNMVKAYLMVNFKIAGETPIWQMWVRTTALAPSTGSSVGN